MGLEINIGENRTYTKIISVSNSEGVTTIATLNKRNSIENGEMLDSFTFPSDSLPTTAEAYELIKVLPEFDGYYDC